MFLFMNTSKYD